MISNREIGMRLRKLLADRQISVREVQERMGLESPQSVYKWLHGKSLPTLGNMISLSRILGVKIEDILIGASIPEENKPLPSFQRERGKLLLLPGEWQMRGFRQRTLLCEKTQEKSQKNPQVKTGRRKDRKPLPGCLRQMLLRGWDLEYRPMQKGQAQETMDQNKLEMIGEKA